MILFIYFLLIEKYKCYNTIKLIFIKHNYYKNYGSIYIDK